MLSFQLFKQGKSIAQIALERKLSVGTIENHLLRYLVTKEITIDELVSKDKQAAIIRELKDFDSATTGPVKERLGEGFSYGEIRFVIASMNNR